MAALEIDITRTDVFKRLVVLIKEVAEETTEPHIREKIITEIRQLQEEAENGH